MAKQVKEMKPFIQILVDEDGEALVHFTPRINFSTATIGKSLALAARSMAGIVRDILEGDRAQFDQNLAEILKAFEVEVINNERYDVMTIESVERK